jgi:hypothetical protein
MCFFSDRLNSVFWAVNRPVSYVVEKRGGRWRELKGSMSVGPCCFSLGYLHYIYPNFSWDRLSFDMLSALRCKVEVKNNLSLKNLTKNYVVGAEAMAVRRIA